jgi:hypothetical protein
LLVADTQVIGSETCPRGARAPGGADSAGDAARLGPGSGGHYRGARTSLEVARQSAEDRASTAETAAAIERDSLPSRLALAEAEVEKLRAAATSAEEAAERAKTAVVATESAARDAAQAAAREKAALEVKVSELERDLGTTMTDLATTGLNSPRLQTNFRWSPRRRRGCATPMRSCRRILMVRFMVPPLYSVHRLLFIGS